MGPQVKEQGFLLTDYETSSAYSTAYHTLYTNMHLNWDSEQTKQHAILLTTPAYYPGQATAAANIAIAAAQSGTRTLLIDANLRRPSLHELFRTGNTPGLSDWFVGQGRQEEHAVHFLSKTFIPELRLLNVGTVPLQVQEIQRLFLANWQDTLTSIRNKLVETESQPGLIIINGPPVLAGIEASLIGAQAEQTYLLIATGQTTRTQAKLAQEQLRRAHAKLSGIIMVDV